MNKIKVFTYLDEEKMYSISAQIFEGLTEQIISYSSNTKKELEQQKGPKGSGRVLADIVGNNLTKEERKFLHDYSYTVFEQKILEDKEVAIIDNKNIDIIINDIDKYDFIKVRGKLLFNDFNVISNMLKNFNNIGENLTYIKNKTLIDTIHASNYEKVKSNKNSQRIESLKKETQSQIKMLTKELALNEGLNFDEIFLERISNVLDYGYKNQLEIQIPLKIIDNNHILFSTNLTRDDLKESEELFIKRHSRYSERDFVIFGMITQSSRAEINLTKPETPNHPKEAISILISLLTDIENTFIGRLYNEIIIEPIAVYREI